MLVRCSNYKTKIEVREESKVNDAAKKFDDGKLRFELVPTAIQFECAKVYTDGAKKYGDRNWEKGLAVSRAFGSVMRHVMKFWSGQDIDPDHGTHHLAHAIVELQMIHETLRVHPELDDRPNPSMR